MKLIINTSNLKKGGSLQVAHSFLVEIKDNATCEFHVVLSTALSKQINTKGFPSNFTFYNYTIKPNIFKAITGSDSYLNNLETTLKPDCVFTVFGPSYWVSKTRNHLMGYAIPHYIYPESPFFSTISLKTKIEITTLKILHRKNLRKTNIFFCVETNDTKLRLAKFINTDLNKIYVISNTAHSVFDDFISNQVCLANSYSKLAMENSFKFITVSAAYPHKNLEVLKQLIPILRIRNINCKFYLTLDEKSFAQFVDLSDYVSNLGSVTIEDCPQIYYNSDALFLPTLLECFSASYPEAMKMGKCILTSDLPFAHDICGDAALYFNPLEPKDIVDKIEMIIHNEKLRNKLVEKGYKQLNNFETAKSRAEKYLEICNSIAK